MTLTQRHSDWIEVDFEINEKKVRQVNVVDLRKYATTDEIMRGLTRQIRLDNILASENRIGINIVDLLKTLSPRLVRNEKESLVAEYDTGYGVLTCRMQSIRGGDRIVEVGLAQKSMDLFSYLSNGRNLAQMPEAVVGKTPEGLRSATSGFRIAYSDAKDRPFDTYTVYSTQEAPDNRSFRSEKIMRLRDYKRCHDAAEIDVLKIPIPKNHKVITDDPKYENIELAVRENEIVRTVDGASLQAVAVERRTYTAALSVALSVLALVLGVVGFRILRRRQPHRRGMPQ